MSKEKSESKRVVKQTYVTGIGSYMNVFKPRAVKEGSTPKYSVAILIPKNDPQLKQLNKLVQGIALEAFGPGWQKAQKAGKFWYPIQDGDDKEQESYSGHMYINASNERKPGLVDINRNEVSDPEECYSGCTVQASINFFSYVYMGKTGVGAGLNNIRVIKKGEHLDGRVNPTDEQWPEVEGEDEQQEEESDDDEMLA